MQFGGQTPLKLAAGLEAAGVPLLGTSPEAIDLAEDRGRFGALLDRLGLEAPPYATAHGAEEALAAAPRVGFPLLVRPSYVLGGRAMELVYRRRRSSRTTCAGPARTGAAEIFLDRFLENAIEVDVDAICDGEDVWIGGIMQHVEEAGIHSGDSACVLPPHSLGAEMLREIRAATRSLALELGVVGLMNVQYGVLGDVALRDRGQPARVAHRAVRVQGDRAPARQARLPRDARRAARRRSTCPRIRAATTCRSRRPCSRSTASPAPTRCSGPRCARRARSWASRRTSRRRSRRRRRPRARGCPQSGTVFLTVTDSDKSAIGAVAAQLHDLGF